MPFVVTFILGLVLWLFAEIAVFGLVADWIGLAGALLATLLTSLIGMALLRRLGDTAQGAVSAMFADPKGSMRLTPGALQSGVSAALGAVLLILPGFLSDCVGLALVAPSLRRLETPPPKTQAPDVLDLPAQEWRHIDEADRR